MKNLQLIAVFIIGAGLGAIGAWVIYWQPQMEKLRIEAESLHTNLELQKEKFTAITNPKIAELKKERETIHADISLLSSELQYCDEGTALCILTKGAINELKTADALMLQQVAALESGAPVTLEIKQTHPNLELAVELNKEVETATAIISKKIKAAEKLGGLMAITAKIEIMTENINLAILKRNYLIAKYGLSTPFDAKVASVKSEPKTPQLTPKEEDVELAPQQIQDGITFAPEDKTHTPTPTEKIFANEEGWQVSGNWAIKSEDSLMGDAKNVSIINISPKMESGRLTGRDSQAWLCIRCANNKIELYVNFRNMLDATSLGSNAVNIEYKIDDKDIVKTNWSQSTDFQGAFATKPIPLIKELFGAQKIAFRAKLYNSTAVTETYFNLGGLKEAIKPIQESCGWK